MAATPAAAVTRDSASASVAKGSSGLPPGRAAIVEYDAGAAANGAHSCANARR